MLKNILYIIVIAFVASCKQEVDHNNDVLNVRDTELAQFIDPGPLKQSDSMAILQIFSQLKIAFRTDDQELIKQLSLPKVFIPLYDTGFKRFYHRKKLPSWVFAAAPFRKEYMQKFSSIIDTATYEMHIEPGNKAPESHEDASQDTQIFTLAFSHQKIVGRETLYWQHLFSFTKMNGQLKFSGLDVFFNTGMRPGKMSGRERLFFPLSENRYTDGALDTFSNLWYSEILDTMQEPVLFTGKTNDPVYRFTWIRSFDAPLVIRIEPGVNTYRIITKKMDRMGLDDVNSIWSETSGIIGTADWRKIKRDFLPVRAMQFKDTSQFGSDGSRWILESVVDGKYNFIDRWCGGEDFFRACALHMLSLSGVKIRKEDIY